MSLRIVIVDDHEAAREGLAVLLSCPEVEIVGSYSDGEGVCTSTDAANVVLLDVRMPSNDGLAVLEQIRANKPDLPIVMLTSYDNPTYVARASALGATDYLLKSDDKLTMLATIANAAEHKTPIKDGMICKIQQMMRRKIEVSLLPDELPLTQREAQVLRHVGLGLSNKEIASSLTISVETVKEHVQNILRKIGAKDRTDAAVRANKLGLVE